MIKRINTALQARDYAVWIDIEKMQGSTVEMMADAVEDCAVMCYGISKAYKESTNCRMEAQYAFQQQVDMVPLMLEHGADHTQRFKTNPFTGYCAQMHRL